jgi:titin
MALLTTQGPAPLVYTDNTVVVGLTYRYQVTAVTIVGEGAASSAASGMAFGLPGIPLDLNATARDGEVTLAWDAPEDDGGRPILGYTLFRGTSSTDLRPHVELDAVTSHVDSEVVNGQRYYYAIAASNEAGMGERTEVVEATPQAPPTTPGPPMSLLVEVRDDTVVLTWQAPESDGGSPITGYTVFRGISGEDLVDIAVLGVVLTYTDEEVEQGTTYSYRVVAKNVVGHGEVTQIYDAEIEKEEKKDEPGFVSIGCILAVGLVAALMTRRRR